jgi:hypothetical protein
MLVFLTGTNATNPEFFVSSTPGLREQPKKSEALDLAVALRKPCNWTRNLLKYDRVTPACVRGHELSSAHQDRGGESACYSEEASSNLPVVPFVTQSA